MNRFWLVAAATLLGPAVPSQADAGRTLSADYRGAALAVLPRPDGEGYLGLPCTNPEVGQSNGCLNLVIARGEQVITIDVVDRTGLAVGWSAFVEQEPGPHGCGRTTLTIRPGQHWDIGTLVDPTCPGQPTTGRLTARLSRS